MCDSALSPVAGLSYPRPNHPNSWFSMPGDESLEELLAQTALGRRAAFDRLYERTCAKLFGVALRLLKDRAEAEDALQEIYVRIWNRADSYAVTGASPMSWLIAIARNHAIDRLRARKPAHEGPEAADHLPDPAPSPEQRAIASGESQRLARCLGRLEADRAQAVRGAYLEGYSYSELAARHAVPLNTMRTWLRRSLIKLRECLEE